jgi:hypothetical protein
MPAFFIAIIAAITLLGIPEAGADGTRVAQAAAVSQAQHASNRAANALAASQKSLKAVRAEKAALRTIYNEQLAEVDKLKRSRASWRRDRQLREQKARSQKTALALKAIDQKLKARLTAVSKARTALASAIDKELDESPTQARQTYLQSMLGQVRVGLRQAPKKISMPELELDEFADPEELMEQIALIERAEKKLAAEQASLSRRAAHFDKMEALRSKRNRSDALGAFDPDGVRRSTGHIGESKDSRDSGSTSTSGLGQGSGADAESSPNSPSPPPGGTDDFSDDSSSFAVASVVLADVVDSGTRDALRRAQLSKSPKTKALAAKRAQGQVEDRLQRLRASKLLIQRHLDRLKKR